jgi:hypothetical protein
MKGCTLHVLSQGAQSAAGREGLASAGLASNHRVNANAAHFFLSLD